MSKARIGKLPPRYKFILNQYTDERLSKCPLCRKPTHQRKLALFIHIDEWGPMVFGKTGPYCSPCELIIIHQHELEAELAYSFSKFAPEMIGKEYLVVGTVDKKTWKGGLTGKAPQFEDVLKGMADFKKVYSLHVEPGGWYPAN